MDKMRLQTHSQASHEALLTGTIGGDSGWVVQKQEGSELVFARQQTASPALWFRVFKSIRVMSLTATFFPAMAVVLLNLAGGFTIDVWTLISAILAMLMLQIAVNVFNDVEDYLKLIDLPGSLGGSGVIQSGWLSVVQLKRLGWLAFVSASVLAIPALIKSPEYVLGCAAFAGLGVMGYSGKPFRFKYRALGDVFVFLLCGPILSIGVSIAATNAFDLSVIILGVFYGFIACGILNANNINDINVDSHSGARTLASVLGFTKARWLQSVYYAAALISLFCLAWMISAWLLLPCLALPLVYQHLSVLFQANYCDDVSLSAIRFDAAKLHMALSVLVCVSLIITL